MIMLNRFIFILGATCFALSLGACAGSLKDQLDEQQVEESSDPSDAVDTSDPSEASDASDPVGQSDPSDASDSETTESKITNFPQEDGVTLTLANATDNNDWVYFDFETQAQVFPENPVDSDAWDVAFRRYRVKLNGGYYGTGDVIVSALDGVTLAEVTEAPTENWASDRADIEDDDDELPEEALSSWYDYDVTTHVLTPIERVYAIRTVEGAFFKLEFAGYYDQNGASGNPSIRWATLDAPAEGVVEPEIEEPGDTPVESDPTDETDASDVSDATDPSDIDDSDIVNFDLGANVVLTVANATDYSTWIYYDFETQSQVYPETPVDSADWDIAFKRYRVKVNGGYHGTGGVIVSAMDDVTLEDVSEAPADNWLSDGADTEEDEDPLPQEALSSWYQYDSSTHILTPYERVYALRTVEGAFFKLEFAGYYNQDGASGHPSIRWTTVDASTDEMVEPELEEPGDFPEDDEG